MPEELDQSFFDRADAHIHLSNDQLKQSTPGKVSASTMYASARFNAWLTACGFESGEAMQSRRDENIEYFVREYRKMLETNMDEYIARFEHYMVTQETK